jgi:hypothetical protein
VQRKITPLWGEKKVILRQTERAVTPFGGLSVFIAFLQMIVAASQIILLVDLASAHEGEIPF